jgi:hypothetical protein
MNNGPGDYLTRRKKPSPLVADKRDELAELGSGVQLPSARLVIPW